MTPLLHTSLLLALVGQVPGSGPLDTEQDAGLAEMRRVVAASEVYALEGDSRRKLSLYPQPLLRHDNIIRGVLDATLWAFGDESGRPSALYKVHLTRDRVRRSVVTLSDHLLGCRFTTPGEDEPRPLYPNTRTFLTKRPGLAWKPFPDQPTVVLNRPAAVLVQFKALARKFEVVMDNPTQTYIELGRLLPRPLHRYSDASSGVVDGALFNIGHFGVDPAGFLLIELHRQSADADLEWRYAFTRMTAARVTVHLENNLVYQAPSLTKAPGRTETYGNHTTWRTAVRAQTPRD